MATFEVGVETAKVEITSTKVVLTILPRIWQRVKEGPDFDDRGPALARSLRRLLAKQEIVERAENRPEKQGGFTFLKRTLTSGIPNS